MVDALGQIASVQRVPMSRFVGMDDCADLNTLAESFQRLGLSLEGEGKRLAVALASNDDDAALAGLVLSESTIDTVLFVI